MLRETSRFLASLLFLAGCEYTNPVLTNAASVLGSQTARTVLDIADARPDGQPARGGAELD